MQNYPMKITFKSDPKGMQHEGTRGNARWQLAVPWAIRSVPGTSHRSPRVRNPRSRVQETRVWHQSQIPLQAEGLFPSPEVGTFCYFPRF